MVSRNDNHGIMNRNILLTAISLIGFIGIMLVHNFIAYSRISNSPMSTYSTEQNKLSFKDTTIWDNDFKLVEIESTLDKKMQKLYFYKSKSPVPKPLIVSLHTWGGTFSQEDPLSKLSKSKDINYVRPDFRGSNTTKDACCSDLVISDIDQAISYAIANGNVDTSNIFIMGVSGGGYATLCMYMKSKHRIKKFSSWVPISDLVAWYSDKSIQKYNYPKDILACTSSENGILNVKVAKEKSPIYWSIPSNRASNSNLEIYAGVNDGTETGSVSITQSINFYNKLLTDLSVKDKSKYVSEIEKSKLLEYRKPIAKFGKIAGREICLFKRYKRIKLTIFEGGHEMLPEFAVNELIR